MSQTPRAVLFDWEGTLVDFQWNLAGAVAHAQRDLMALGVPADTLDSHYALLRNKAVTAAQGLGIDSGCIRAAVDRVYDRYDGDALARWSLKPDARASLKFLTDHGIPAGLVTNIGRQAVKNALAKFDLVREFQIVVTRNDVSMLKPDTEGIVAALRALQVPNHAALFVGDSTADIYASKQARVPVAIVTGGETSATSILSECPDYVWDSLDNLPTLFTGGE